MLHRGAAKLKWDSEEHGLEWPPAEPVTPQAEAALGASPSELVRVMPTYTIAPYDQSR